MNTDLTVTPEVKKGITSLTKKVANVELKTVEDVNKASNIVNDISQLQKTIEEQRTEFTKPLNASLKAINAFFKKFSAPLDTLDKEIRNKMVLFAEENGPEEQQFGFIHFTAREQINVVDISKVPREYLIVDLAKVKAAIKLGKTIKGIEVTEKKSVSL